MDSEVIQNRETCSEENYVFAAEKVRNPTGERKASARSDPRRPEVVHSDHGRSEILTDGLVESASRSVPGADPSC